MRKIGFFIAMFICLTGHAFCGQETGTPQGPGDATSNAFLDVLEVRSLDVMDVLKLLSKKSGRNIVATKGVQGEISIYLKDVDVMEAVHMIVESNGWAYAIEDDVVKVMTKSEFENKYGYVFGPETILKVQPVQFMDLTELAAVLDHVKTAAGKIIHTPSSRSLILMDTPEAIQSMERIIQGLDKPRKSEVFELTYAGADKILAEVSEVLTPDFGTVRMDVRSNTLVISDMPAKLVEVAKLIKAFDRKDREVLVEAKIIQISLDDEFKLGVDWSAIVSDFHSLTMTGDFDVLGNNDKSGRLSIGTLSHDEYQATVEALETIGNTRILSNPSIVTINNEAAKILVGSTEPYVTTTTTTPSSGPSTIAETVEFIDVGVKLLVTPTIHTDGFITLRIKPEVSSVTSNLVTSNNNTIPIVQTTQAETTVTVKDGVTIVIGGLIKEENITSKKQIPVLGNIPLIGRTFGSEVSMDTQNEIAIFLTPTIITGDIERGAALNTDPPLADAAY